jgi:GNAT superfamily N-acetyltransferase
MWWRLPAKEFGRQRGDANRGALRKIVASRAPTGVLAYAEGQAVGWCAIAPREAYPRLERSRLFKPLDEEPVWSVSCFFVARAYRRRGVTVPLLRAAIELAGSRGARIVEGYPVEPRDGSMPAPWAWTGIASSFARAGFVEAARRSETRPMMRYTIPGGAGKSRALRAAPGRRSVKTKT